MIPRAQHYYRYKSWTTLPRVKLISFSFRNPILKVPISPQSPPRYSGPNTIRNDVQYSSCQVSDRTPSRIVRILHDMTYTI